MLMDLVPSGGRLIISVAAQDDALRLLPSLLRTGISGRPLVLTAAPPKDAGDAHPVLLPAGGFRTAKAALATLRKAVRGRRGGGWLIVDLATPTLRWARSPSQRRTFATALGRLARASALRAVLILSRQDSTPVEIARLKDEAEVFLLLARKGRDWRGQILTARGRYAPGLFEPALYSSGPGAAEASPEAEPGTPGYEAVFDRAAMPLALLNFAGTSRRFNAQTASLLGFAPEELDHLDLAEIVAPASYRRALRALSLVRRRGKADAELVLRRRDGRSITVAVRLSMIGGDVFLTHLREVTHDIASRKNLESALHNRAQALERLPFPSAIFSGGRLVSHNPAFAAAFPALRGSAPAKVTLTRLLGRRHAAALHDPAERRAVEVALEREGGTIWYDVTAGHIDYNGRPAIHCLFVPAGDRRTAIENLRASLDHYRTIVERSPDALALLRDGRVAFTNPRFAALLGRSSPEELRDIPVASLSTGLADFAAGPLQRKGTPAAEAIETEATRSDGTTVVLEVHAARFPFGGSPSALVSCRDVTVRKRDEQAAVLRQKGTELALDLERTLEAAGEPGPLLEGAVQAIMKFFGAQIGAAFLVDEGPRLLRLACRRELPEKLAAAFSDQNVDEGIPGFVMKTREALLLTIAEYPPHLPYRSRFAGEGVTRALFLPLVDDGTVHGILLAARRTEGPVPGVLHAALDILTHRLGAMLARARSFSRLRSAEERYRSAVESIEDVIYQLAPDGTPLFISPNIERLFGYTAGEFFRNPDLWRTALHPDDRPTLAQRILNREQKADAFHLEYRVLPKGKASYRWVRDSIRYRRDAEGSLLAITGILGDVSERIELEAALIKSEEMKSNVLESVQEGVLVLDREMRCIDWNRAMEAVTGVTRGEVIGRTVAEALPPLAEAPTRDLIERALLGESVSTEDLPVPGREDLFVWMRFSPLRDSAGAIRGVVAIATDISARRRLEREVRESEETLRNVIDAMGDALMISDLQGKVWEVNREFTRVTGYPRSEVLGLTFPYPWLLEEEMSRLVTWIAELREKTGLRDFDMTWRAKDDRTLAISLNTTMLRNARGEPVAMLNIARDITDRRRLGRELETRNRELLALNTIATSISRSLNLDDVLDVACHQIREIVRADLVLVYLHDRGRDRLVLARSLGLSADHAGRIASLSASASATGTVIGEKTPLWIGEGLGADRRVTEQGRTVFTELGISSLGVIPLQAKEEVLGALDVAFADEHRFTEQERQLLLLIGNQLGPAIENAQLYAEVQSQVGRITALYELGRRLTGALDMRTLLESVWQETAKVIPLHRFSYQTFSEARHSMTPLFIAEERAARYGADVEGGGERLVDQDDPAWDLVTNGVSLRREIPGPDGTPVSLLAVPVRSKDRLLGMLALEHGSARAYAEVHLRLLESIGNLTGIAVEKARLYEDTIAKSAEIAERNKDLDDFTYVVSHDLKEPLISIEGYSRILLKDYRDRVDEEGKEYLNAVVQSTGRMKHLIDDLLTLSRLGRVSESAYAVSSRQVVEEILHDLRFTILERRVTIMVAPDLPEVRYDATQLSMVFRNLISNAIKFNTKPEPTIAIGWERRADHLEFSVADNGIGIEPQFFDKVFLIFQRLQRSEEYRGTGAGLTIVKKIVEKHRGRIWISSVPGEGTTFFFTVPTGG